MSTPMKMTPPRRSREQRLAALIRLGKTVRPAFKAEAVGASPAA